MNRKILTLITILVMCILLVTGCQKEPEQILVEGSSVVNVKAEGITYDNGLKMDFSEESELYSLEKLKFVGTHNSVNCDNCGYTEIDGEKAYKICDHPKHYNGFCITFKTPLKSSSISSATITFKTSDIVKKSEIRITSYDADKREDFVNNKTYITGGESEWETTNVGISSFNELDNAEGFVEGFQLYVYNKDKVDFYLKDITLKLNAEEICTVDLGTTAIGEQGACEDIANKIKNAFEGANLASEITVYCNEYKQNTSAADGEIVYSVDAKMSESKTFTFNNIKKTVPALKGAWLDGQSEYYPVEQKLDKNWKDNFTDAGSLVIDKSKISCIEGIKSLEYAVIDKDTDYKSEDIIWYNVTCDIDNKKIKDVAINSFLDYGNKLEEGKAYKFVLRAVTNNNNYILHLENDFNYKPYSNDKNASIENSFEKLNVTSIYLSKDNATSNNLKDKLVEALDDKNVSVVVKELSNNVSTSKFKVSVTYSDEDFVNCAGEAFTNNNYIVWHNEADAKKTIMPVSPDDGKTGINIASDDIYRMSFAKYDEFISEDFGYKKGENCTPIPVSFEWTDKNPKEGKSYTLLVSENSDMSNAFETTVEDTKAEVYNLKTGTKYYWKVIAEDKEESPIFSFKTLVGITRFINAEGIKNFRDIGGYVTQDNKLIKQGLLYRAAELNKLKKTGQKVCIDQLGIKLDLDLRESNSGSSPLGSKVKYKNVSIMWYNNIFESEATKKDFARAIKVFAEEKNYPICFHCSLGRDRTGTVSIFLLGLLGVDEETIVKEYYMSLFSEKGSYDDTEMAALQLNLDALWSQLDAYGDEKATLNQKIEAFLLEIGVTEDEIESIRKIMLEEIPEDYYDDDAAVENKNTSKTDNDTLTYIIIIAAAVIIAASIVVVVLVLRKKKANKK